MILNYQQTIEFLFSRLPMYQRIGPAAYKANLNNSLYLDEILGHPHRNYPCIHVAGTNGKGSVCHLLSSVFQEAGYNTGLYTSPHLLDFRERIKVNGKAADENFIISFTDKINKTIEQIKPSFFEITTAMAFQYFAEKLVDVAIIETGLGGRLDSTNIIMPVLSVITNISLEHTALLGNTIQLIATEKAGIIKKDVPVVIGRRCADIDDIFSKHSPEVFFAEDEYQCFFKGYENDFSIFDVRKNNLVIHEKLFCGLSGSYQQENLATIMKCIDILQPLFRKINYSSVKNGIKNVIKNTALYGRWQIIRKNPMIILDIAHNQDAISKMLLQLKNYHFKKLHIVLGMSSDKNHIEIIKLLPGNANYYFCKPNVPRGLDSGQLLKFAQEYNLAGIDSFTVDNGISNALSKASENDMILITGSAFTVADALNFFIQNRMITLN